MSAGAASNLFAKIDEIAAWAVAIRHDLHQHPELGYHEKYISGIVCKELKRLGIEYKTGLAGGTGVLGIIHGTGDASGPCVALRADMDALPVTEATGLPYASKTPGMMHACGHDGHTSVLLGAAACLQAARTHFKGTIKLIFQPAEEGGCGAGTRMCEDGVLENPKVDGIFGLHGWPGMKVGIVATREGPLLAAVDGFSIIVTGRGGHAAAPHDAVDPIVCAAAIVQSLQTIVSREAEATDASVLTVSQFHSGTMFNIIPDTAELNGTLRSLSQTRRDSAIASLERIALGVADAYRCKVSFKYYGTTPCTINSRGLAEFVRDTARAVLGDKQFAWVPKPAMWGEDFAFYLQRVPGCFYVLGVQPMDRDSYPMLHTPGYDFTDAAVPVGIRMMTELAVRFLER